MRQNLLTFHAVSSGDTYSRWVDTVAPGCPVYSIQMFTFTIGKGPAVPSKPYFRAYKHGMLIRDTDYPTLAAAAEACEQEYRRALND